MTSDRTIGSVRSADGTRIAFELSGSGPTLVLVEAAGCYGDFGSLRPLADRLAADLTVLTYDRRGRGGSTDAPPYSIGREVDDLAALVAGAGGSASLYGASSGGLLALQAAAQGLDVPKLALFEPPIGGPIGRPDFVRELTALLAADRRGDAARRFLGEIGVPPEVTARMGPEAWSALEAVAPTLVYDCVLCAETSPAHVASVTAPTLVIDSEGSTPELAAWTTSVARTLPDGTHHRMAGDWHGVSDEDLAPVLAAFFLG
jgi:pimeloyl-ACP methyl ester carboxylesterase